MAFPPLHKVSREDRGGQTEWGWWHGYHTEESSTFSTCARRSASQASVWVVVFEFLWIPKLSVCKLHIVWSFRIPYWYFAYELDQPGEITWQGFNGMLHYGNNKMFFHCKFWSMVSCIQITLQHQSVLDFSMCLFQVWGAYFFPQISICSHLSPRLTALEKEARYVRNQDRWMDWWAGCTLLFPHYRFYRVTLYWCNDWDVWNFKSHSASSGCLWTVIMYVQRSV